MRPSDICRMKIPLSTFLVGSHFYQLRVMDNILEMISKNDAQKLDETLLALQTKKTSNLDLKTKDFEKLLVFASYSGSVNCLQVLLKFGK